MVCKRKKESKMTPRFFGRSNQKDRDTIYVLVVRCGPEQAVGDLSLERSGLEIKIWDSTEARFKASQHLKRGEDHWGGTAHGISPGCADLHR